MKRHRTIVGPSMSPRSLAPAVGRASLPTVAAIAAVLSFASAAQAITSSKDAGADEAAVDADVSDVATDAAYCEPPVEPPRLGGVPPRVHGTGCGCGGASGDESGMAMVAAASLVALLRQLRRL
jgi:hypothetical protein